MNTLDVSHKPSVYGFYGDFAENLCVALGEFEAIFLGGKNFPSNFEPSESGLQSREWEWGRSGSEWRSRSKSERSESEWRIEKNPLRPVSK